MKKALDGIFTLLRNISREQKRQTKLLTDIKESLNEEPKEVLMTAEEFEKFKKQTN